MVSWNFEHRNFGFKGVISLFIMCFQQGPGNNEKNAEKLHLCPMPIFLGNLPVLRVDEAITFKWDLREWFQVSELADVVWFFGKT